MKIGSTADTFVLPLSKRLQSKTLLSVLLQLSKPLNTQQARVVLADNREITLNIKTPLEKGTLYHAVIQKEGDEFAAKELFKLPVTLKTLLKTPAQIELHTLIAKLSHGEEPKKIAAETLFQQILSAPDKEAISPLLDQLGQILLSDFTSIIYEYRGLKGYVSFKKDKREFSQKVLRFEAYFPLLGALKGEVSFIDGSKAVHIQVMSQRSKAILEEAKGSLGMRLTVKVERDFSIEVPAQKILDIKG